MDNDHGGSIEQERPLHHLAWIDRGVINGALLLHLVGDEVVLPVQEEDANLFYLSEGHGRLAVVEQGLPVA